MISTIITFLGTAVSAVGSFLGTWGLPIYYGSVGVSGAIQYFNNRISNSRLRKKGNIIHKSREVNTIGERIKYLIKDNFYCFVPGYNLYKSFKNFIQSDKTTDSTREAKLKDRGMLEERKKPQPEPEPEQEQQVQRRQVVSDGLTPVQRRRQRIAQRETQRNQQPVQQTQQPAQLTVADCRSRFNALRAEHAARKAAGASVQELNDLVHEMNRYREMAHRIQEIERLTAERDALLGQTQGPTRRRI